MGIFGGLRKSDVEGRNVLTVESSISQGVVGGAKRL
jgi:hypothetical protein